MIERIWYQAEVLDRLRTVPVAGLVGARQCGKTSLAKSLLAEHYPEAVYLDLQLPSHRARLADAESYLRLQGERLVVLDEVQEMPELFAILRGLVDEDRRPGRFLLLGSASPALLRESSDSLAGRISYVGLPTLAYWELPAGSGLREHWLRGGYPEAYEQEDDRLRRRWYEDYVDTFIARDLAQMSSASDGQRLRRLVTMLSHVHGGTINYAKLANSLDITGPTVRAYTDVLEQAYLLRRVPSWSANVGKRLTKTPKVYVRDSGLLHWLQRVADLDQLYGHPGVGASWEGYVVEQIATRLGSDRDLYHYRTAKGQEIDLLIASPGGAPVAVEMKMSNAPTLTRSWFAALADVKPRHTYVVTPEAERYPVGEGVEVMGVEAFLEEVGGAPSPLLKGRLGG